MGVVLALAQFIMWCIVTLGLKFHILNETFPKSSMNSLSDYSFSCLILTKAIEVKWCRRLVVNYAPNFSTSVWKQSMDNYEKRVNQLNTAGFNVVGNTRQRMTLFHVYKIIYVVYIRICASIIRINCRILLVIGQWGFHNFLWERLLSYRCPKKRAWSFLLPSLGSFKTCFNILMDTSSRFNSF